MLFGQFASAPGHADVHEHPASKSPDWKLGASVVMRTWLSSMHCCSFQLVVVGKTQRHVWVADSHSKGSLMSAGKNCKSTVSGIADMVVSGPLPDCHPHKPCVFSTGITLHAEKERSKQRARTHCFGVVISYGHPQLRSNRCGSMHEVLLNGVSNVQGGDSGGMAESVESAEAIGRATALRFVSRYPASSHLVLDTMVLDDWVQFPAGD